MARRKSEKVEEVEELEQPAEDDFSDLDLEEYFGVEEYVDSQDDEPVAYASDNPARAVIDELEDISSRIARDAEFGDVLHRGAVRDNIAAAVNLLRVSA